MRNLPAFAAGVLLVAILGATRSQQPESPRFQGFPLSDSTWVVVNEATGISCHYTPLDFQTRALVQKDLIGRGFSPKDAVAKIAQSARYCLRGP